MATCPKCQQPYDAGTFCPRDGTRLVGDAGPGAVIGDRYRLIRMVGSGGVGEVYEAEHVYIHRRVAVKILRREIASDPEAVARLQREAQSTSGLGHPNIVDCFDFGHSAEGQVYLVMEWLDGENLDQRLQREPVDIPTALEIASQVAAGLAEAHDRGVIHRDLKPANLFLIRDRRGALVVKVLDFGIAKLAAQQTKLTGTSVLVGTPNYMAPEQAFGEAVDARTDVYALGVILYEMVTGSVPFHADSPLGVLHQHTARMPVPPSARAPERGISSELETVVMRCLAKRPEERFASMHEVIAALEALRGTAAAPRESLPPPPPPRGHDDDDDDLLNAAGVVGGRRIALVVGGVALVAGGVVAALLLMRGGGRGAAAPPDASRPAANAPDAGLATRVDAATIAPTDTGIVVAVPDAGVPPAWRNADATATFRTWPRSRPRARSPGTRSSSRSPSTTRDPRCAAPPTAERYGLRSRSRTSRTTRLSTRAPTWSTAQCTSSYRSRSNAPASTTSVSISSTATSASLGFDSISSWSTRTDDGDLSGHRDRRDPGDAPSRPPSRR